jgi:protein TonB
MPTHVRLATAIILTALALHLACTSPPPKPTTYALEDECPNGTIPWSDQFTSDVFAEMIHYEQPTYPALAEKAGLEGTVWIKALITILGNVIDAAVYKSSGHEILDRAALEAAPRCRFTPAYVNGEPACIWVTYKVIFSLSDKQGF